MDDKFKINIAEKLAIGNFAASLIKDNDLVYVDAGSSVEAMITFIKGNNVNEVTFVTNSIYIARELSALKYKVFILPGEVKLSTDSIIGVSATQYLSRFNFSIGFFGVNGIHKDFGFTTPDINEAMVKEEAMKRCKKSYVLADSSKFEKVSQVSFGKSVDCEIITEVSEGEGFRAKIVRL
ncbi:sugar phosphate isomerase family [Helcococcus sueciensis]